MKSVFYILDIVDDMVFIVDNARIAQTMSVTNDAEAVVEYLNKHYPNKRVIYKDTEGQWDELYHENGEFKQFLPYHGHHP